MIAASACSTGRAGTEVVLVLDRRCGLGQAGDKRSVNDRELATRCPDTRRSPRRARTGRDRLETAFCVETFEEVLKKHGAPAILNTEQESHTTEPHAALGVHYARPAPLIVDVAAILFKGG